MTRSRYVLFGLGRARSPWFGNVARWSTSGAVPAEFSKCLSVGEVRQCLDSLAPKSALLLEAGVAGVDSDVVAKAVDHGVPVVVIDAHAASTSQHWIDSGATTVFTPEFELAELLQILSMHCVMVHTKEDITPDAAIEDIACAWSGRLIAVTGPGGTGASSAAIALAQGLSSSVDFADNSLLADFVRKGELAMLHDSAEVVPSIDELVEAHRSRRATAEDVRSFTFEVPARGYRLLLGMRRPTSWTAMSPRVIESAVAGLRRAFAVTVADIAADFEGDTDGGGSADVEERNALSRTAGRLADVVVVVGRPGMKGTHALARTVRELVDFGVAAERVVTVVMCAPKRPSAKAEITKALAQLVDADIRAPIFVSERPIDDALRDGTVLPRPVVEPLTSAVQAVLDNSDWTSERPDEPERVVPGTLGMAVS